MNTWKKHKACTLPTAGDNTGPIRISIGGTFTYHQIRILGFMGAHHLHILSHEQLREGDKVYECLHDGTPLSIDTCTEDHLIRIAHGIDTQCYKIIASTDKLLGVPGIPESFLKEYCEYGGMDEVMVEYIKDGFKLKETDSGWVRDENDYKLFVKVSDYNEISIKPVKETWTRGEVKQLFNKFYATAFIDPGTTGEMFNKWIKENL